MQGYRNFFLGILAMILMAWIAWVAGPDHVTELGGTYGGIGLTVAGIVAGRAANKLAVKKGGSEDA